MAAELRVLKQRVKSTQAIKKITRAMELIATSRIGKAQARVAASRPYTEEITKVLSSLATASTLSHPLLVAHENPTRAAVLVVTSDKGMCGGYNSNVIKAAEELQTRLRQEGKQPFLYVIGRKGAGYYRFRQREVVDSWTGFSEKPTYADIVAAGDALVEGFLADAESGAVAFDEVHVVYTEFRSMMTQQPIAKRVVPLEVEYAGEDETDVLPGYDFEPDPETLLDALLPKYIKTRLYSALLESAASELANRQRAMKAATDNASEMIRALTREANQARQAQITQEISEIVGGADALATAGSDE
ncbi:F0F1 ATP synthase subunit gamma [Allokutzneria albata]|uniref:ATP synthase gamma chain n=1 Tax=Allokutzneria albata TaxID=211114 RepID=A0A1G9XT33_ALLAB|nr:F0F1 ATP synthase subunit gamma [Allokutzneria albata]SDM99979.1 ATP synthase F1 subcomplex gamma subunit [Allokutzneria albata]